MNQTLRVEMLGRLAVKANGDTFTRFRSRQTASLLAYLAYFPKSAHSRERLADTFWPDADQEAGRLALRVALSSLRRILEPPPVAAGSILEADRLTIRLNPTAVITDVREFEANLKGSRQGSERDAEVARLRTAVELYAGDLLPDHHEEWVVRERERLAWARHEAIGRLRDLLAQAGSLDEAIAFARVGAAEQPCDDSANEALIRLLVQRRLLSDAKRHYVQFKSRLQSEIGIEPSAGLRDLVESLPATEAQPEAAQIKGTTPQIRSKRDADVQGRAHGRPPPRLNRFFGRETELKQLTDLVADGHQTNRLVTLTGMGGCGKTRLLTEAAHQMGGLFPEGVWFVDLSGLSSADRIPNAISAALGLQDPGDLPNALNRGRMLLCLDNMEHLVADEPNGSMDGPLVVRDLLNMAPELVCLVTSRRRLEIDGEVQVVLGPLSVPGEGLNLAGLVGVPSVALFIDRARRVQAHFAATPGNAAAIGQLCRRLEGLPLAVELAAAWSHTLAPAQILQRLERKEPILSSRNRGGLERHRSLRAVLSSSFEQLPNPLLGFIAGLSVFRGGWTEDAATFVCNEPNSLEMLSDLHGRSLIAASDWQGSKRFRMLESIREFAAESLDPNRMAELEERHGAYIESLVAHAQTRGRTFDQLDWLYRLEAEEDNIQAALGRSAAIDPSRALRIVCAVAGFWEVGCRDAEILDWLERLLDTPSLDPRLRAAACMELARVHTRNGRYEQAVPPLELALSLNGQEDDPHLEASAKWVLAVALVPSDPIRARAVLDDALRIGEQCQFQAIVCDCLLLRGGVEARDGRPANAKELLGRALAVSRETQDLGVIPELLGALSEATYETGEYLQAAGLAREALTMLIHTRDKMLKPQAHYHLGRAQAAQGFFVDARRHFQKSLRMYERVDLTRDCALCRLAQGSLDLAQSRLKHAESHYRQALEEGTPFVRVQLRGGIGLSLLAIDCGDFPEAMNRLLACFALPGPTRAGDSLRLLEAGLFCLNESSLHPEVESWYEEIMAIRKSTRLAQDRLDQIVYERIMGQGRGYGRQVAGLDDLMASVRREIDRLRANDPATPLPLI